MKIIEKQSQNCGCADNNQPDVMRSNLISMHRSSITTSETSQSQGRQVRRSTTVSSRIISRSHVSTSADARTFYVAWMDFAGVMTTRGWSSPRVNSFSTDSNAHGVFSIDAFDKIPTSSDIANRICDADAFIKELELWAMHNNINQNGQANTPTQCAHGTEEVGEINALENHSSDNEISNSCTDETAAGSKNFKVAHVAILSYKNEARYV